MQFLPKFLLLSLVRSLRSKTKIKQKLTLTTAVIFAFASTVVLCVSFAECEQGPKLFVSITHAIHT